MCLFHAPAGHRLQSEHASPFEIRRRGKIEPGDVVEKERHLKPVEDGVTVRINDTEASKRRIVQWENAIEAAGSVARSAIGVCDGHDGPTLRLKPRFDRHHDSLPRR